MTYKDWLHWDEYSRWPDGSYLLKKYPKHGRLIFGLWDIWRSRTTWIRYAHDICFRVLPCKLFGHQYVDDGSYANSESAEDRLSCKYCGHSINHIYY